MMKKLDYLVEISGNEALLERYIIAIEGDQCQAALLHKPICKVFFSDIIFK